MRSRSRLAASAALVAAVLLLESAHTQDDQAESEPLDRTPRRCLAMGTIESTVTIDNKTLLFLVRGDRAYRNDLPRTCRNLYRNDSISHASSGGRMAQLCEGTLFAAERGVSNREPYNCQLGEFVPITKEEAAELLSRRD